ncbi:MAG: DNA-directed RNA polymerase subunit omega [Clostridia bacterium]|nr:DNA-directed RNA polymerase subunit omega [Clostridia bacterium]
MITKPSIDQLTNIAKNKYILCCSVSKRAKQINEGTVREEIITNAKSITRAADEIADGVTTIVKED